MKVFMHCDMEGASGIYSAEQVGSAQGRDLLIADVNSAAMAALETGVGRLEAGDWSLESGGTRGLRPAACYPLSAVWWREPYLCRAIRAIENRRSPMTTRPAFTGASDLSGRIRSGSANVF